MAYLTQKDEAKRIHLGELQASHDLLSATTRAIDNGGTYEHHYQSHQQAALEARRHQGALDHYMRNNPYHPLRFGNLRFIVLPYDNKLIVTFCSDADLHDFIQKRTNGGPTR